jgi:hypothetical protein
MKINQKILSISLIVIVFGTIFTTNSLGLWKTTNSKIPATFQSGEFKGQYNPADIRGSYSFGEISNLYNVPIEDLATAFGLEDEKSFADFKCKDLEATYVLAKAQDKEVGTDSVKIFVALYKGLPVTLTDTSYFPKTVTDVLIKQGKMTPQQTDYINSHLVDIEKAAKSIEENSSEENASFIKGKTTFKEVLAIGVKKEDIEKAINTNIEDTSAVIKDFCTQKELKFSEVKTDIQKIIDQK